METPAAGAAAPEPPVRPRRRTPLRETTPQCPLGLGERDTSQRGSPGTAAWAWVSWEIAEVFRRKSEGLGDEEGRESVRRRAAVAGPSACWEAAGSWGGEGWRVKKGWRES